MNECGTLVVAQNKAEERVLFTLLGMGQVVGVPGLRVFDEPELKRREPEVRGVRALFSPTGAVVDSVKLLEAVSEEVKSLGGRYVMEAKVFRVSHGNVVESTKGDYQAGHIVNAAGLYSDQIAWMMGAGLNYVIIPFRGEYLMVEGVLVSSMVYQAPDLCYPFLSVHLTKSVHGELLAGPTATLAFGRESYDKQIQWGETKDMLARPHFWKLILGREFLGLALHNGKISLLRSAFLSEIRKLCPAACASGLKPYRSGIRAQMVDRSGRMLDDIVVEFKRDSTHILNAVSPGMTSCLAFSEYVVNHMHTAA